ncbi:MAG: outer membrane beta-barrel protein [Alistipes sp.]|jgi:hypothetical protein|nr:outer membrane beta-barrel protein [Alistipes sp.]
MKTTRLLVLTAAALLLCAGVQAQTPTEERPGKFSVHLGVPLLSVGGETFSKEAGGISLGLLATPKNLFMLDLNFGDSRPKLVGDFTYYVYNPLNQQQTTHTGRVEYGYSAMELAFSYNRLFDLSESWQFRVGPAIGMAGIDGSNDFDPWDVEGLGNEDYIHTKHHAFMAGVITGFRWNFAKRGSFDITYLLSGHKKFLFEEREILVIEDFVTIDSKELGNISHRFSVSLGWRFGRSKK